MTPYNEILKLHNDGLNISEIAKGTGTARNTVKSVLRNAELYDLPWPIDPPATDLEIHRLFHQTKKQDDSFPVLNTEAIVFESTLPGRSASRLWTEYNATCKNSGIKGYGRSMYQKIVSDAKAECDVKGFVSAISIRFAKDIPSKGTITIIGKLACSNYISIVTTSDTALRSIARSMDKLLRSFGGDPEHYIMSGRISDKLLDPVIKCLEYYGIAKAGSDINISGINDDELAFVTKALQNRVTVSSITDELNSRPLYVTNRFTISDAHAIERQALRPLPEDHFDYHESKIVAVQYNGHAEIDSHYYSVPFEYLHKKLTAVVSEQLVEIYNKDCFICTHKRLTGAVKYSTDPSHLPAEGQVSSKDVSGASLRSWASKVGPYTYNIIDMWLSKKAYEEQAYRSCKALLHMAVQYGYQVCESSCKAAWEQNQTGYTFITRLIKHSSGDV